MYGDSRSIVSDPGNRRYHLRLVVRRTIVPGRWKMNVSTENERSVIQEITPALTKRGVRIRYSETVRPSDQEQDQTKF